MTRKKNVTKNIDSPQSTPQVEIKKPRKKTERVRAPVNETAQTITTFTIPAGSKFQMRYCELLKEHHAKGLSYEAFAGVIGVSRRTLWNWENEFPVWVQAKEEAYEKSLLYWERMGICGALGVFPEAMFKDMKGVKPKFNALAFGFMVHNRLRKDFKRNPSEFVEPTAPIGNEKIGDQTKDPIKAEELYNRLMGNK